MSRRRQSFRPERWCLAALTGLLLGSGCSQPEPNPGVAVVSLPQYEAIFDGSDLSGWRSPTGDWKTVASVGLHEADPSRFQMTEGQGVLVNGETGRTTHLMSLSEHRDAEIHLEFQVPKGSNSGVYLQGRYEVQILDSWGNYELTFGDCGGIYERWADGKGFEGKKPRINASLPAGEWQRFDIVFRAPRFDETGQKFENARFVSVTHNGVLIHENVEVSGPTRSAAYEDERPWGPLLLQGDHGPVAWRNLLVHHLDLP